MSRSETLLLLGTFVFGTLTGAYMYIFNFAAVFDFSLFGERDGTRDSFSIVAESYGACRQMPQGCGALRVAGNRDYTFIRTDADRRVLTRREGLLASALFDNVVDELRMADQMNWFDRYETTRPTCSQSPVGVLYTIEVKERGRFYLDSCLPNIASDDRLYLALEDIAWSFDLYNREE